MEAVKKYYSIFWFDKKMQLFHMSVEKLCRRDVNFFPINGFGRKKKRFSALALLCLLCLLPLSLAGQWKEDAFYIKKIHDVALTQGSSYEWLYVLTREIGGRLSGSPQAAAAVTYTRQMLDTLGLDSVWLQPCQVPHWVRGEKAVARIVNSRKMGSLELRAVALGNSVGAGPAGITAEVVEVKSLDEVDRLGEAGVAGKIVFYNRPMDPTQINTFNAYGGAVDQRSSGASRAAKYGAAAVVVRSMTTLQNDVPHTGGMSYLPDLPQIPALAISTNDADRLSSVLSEERVFLYLRSGGAMLAEKQSYNVIGEIRGSERPEEVILVGGHLDSWDIGEGAHDDGAGCVQAMEVLRLFRRLGYRPRRTIRCVLFMNEENGLRGARTYWQYARENNVTHLAAIESDRGGFTPRGFTCEAEAELFNEKFPKVTAWLPLLEPYGLTFRTGGSGADISGLKSQGSLLFGLYPDSQRYFDYHHAATDVFEAVNRRELELGGAAMTSLVYLLDKYGLD